MKQRSIRDICPWLGDVYSSLWSVIKYYKEDIFTCIIDIIITSSIAIIPVMIINYNISAKNNPHTYPPVTLHTIMRPEFIIDCLSLYFSFDLFIILIIIVFIILEPINPPTINPSSYSFIQGKRRITLSLQVASVFSLSFTLIKITTNFLRPDVTSEINLIIFILFFNAVIFSALGKLNDKNKIYNHIKWTFIISTSLFLLYPIVKLIVTPGYIKSDYCPILLQTCFIAFIFVRVANLIKSTITKSVLYLSKNHDVLETFIKLIIIGLLCPIAIKLIQVLL
ncbi:hypothetical protein ACI3E1_06140 [Ligilactobacillus sp. LYQ139]|uniref:hypothetical protein n=1 Tax=Ligilactobacillus sp. LYQ139 TaxID=3378800 RepID=UPI0038528A9E